MRTSIFLMCALFCKSAFSQKADVFVEGWGAALTYSVNSEFIKQTSYVNGSSFLAVRLGMGLSHKYFQDQSGGFYTKGNTPVFIVGISSFGSWNLSGLGSNHYDLGLCIVSAGKNSFADKLAGLNRIRIYPSANIGFRHQSAQKSSIMWKVDYCPYLLAGKFRHSAGISLGFSFL
jgi:hypothetical protein